ncbi:MAG: hypothetical protein E6K81_07255 [Candidatus Eisenbacteria bacterium]|uniref:Uncharacterized protein n=1 Tax=Eiseniibacteriota bacterium TaxID=2212470 RepID=A0A538U9E7_UNCEI|nr:MAG: hypothetical protein E6K81_07255 [Candidatus Eisenbacteria bacterium]
MTRTMQRRTRKRTTAGPSLSSAARDAGRIRPGRILVAQARIASGYYERPEVKDFLLQALLLELRRH